MPREVFEVSGPDALTGPGLAELWSSILGREVRYGGGDLDAFETQMLQKAPSWTASLRFAGLTCRGSWCVLPNAMIDHTGIGVADLARSAIFYDAVLGALGYRRAMQMPEDQGSDGIGYGLSFPLE